MDQQQRRAKKHNPASKKHDGGGKRGVGKSKKKRKNSSDAQNLAKCERARPSATHGEQGASPLERRLSLERARARGNNQRGPRARVSKPHTQTMSLCAPREACCTGQCVWMIEMACITHARVVSHHRLLGLLLPSASVRDSQPRPIDIRNLNPILT